MQAAALAILAGTGTRLGTSLSEPIRKGPAGGAWPLLLCCGPPRTKCEVAFPSKRHVLLCFELFVIPKGDTQNSTFGQKT